jgi:hypothetical protein
VNRNRTESGPYVDRLRDVCGTFAARLRTECEPSARSERAIARLRWTTLPAVISSTVSRYRVHGSHDVAAKLMHRASAQCRRQVNEVGQSDPPAFGLRLPVQGGQSPAQRTLDGVQQTHTLAVGLAWRCDASPRARPAARTFVLGLAAHVAPGYASTFDFRLLPGP